MPITTPLPILQPRNYFKTKIIARSSSEKWMRERLPLSLGKTCPVKCEFCYELDHSYRETLEPPKTSQEDWEFMLDYINQKPTRSAAVLVPGRQRIHGMDRFVFASQGDGVGRGFSELYG